MHNGHATGGWVLRCVLACVLRVVFAGAAATIVLFLASEAAHADNDPVDDRGSSTAVQETAPAENDGSVVAEVPGEEPAEESAEESAEQPAEQPAEGAADAVPDERTDPPPRPETPDEPSSGLLGGVGQVTKVVDPAVSAVGDVVEPTGKGTGLGSVVKAVGNTVGDTLKPVVRVTEAVTAPVEAVTTSAPAPETDTGPAPVSSPTVDTSTPSDDGPSPRPDRAKKDSREGTSAGPVVEHGTPTLSDVAEQGRDASSAASDDSDLIDVPSNSVDCDSADQAYAGGGTNAPGGAASMHAAGALAQPDGSLTVSELSPPDPVVMPCLVPGSSPD